MHFMEACAQYLEARTLRVNGRYASMDATRQWTLRVNGRPRTCTIGKHCQRRIKPAATVRMNCKHRRGACDSRAYIDMV